MLNIIKKFEKLKFEMAVIYLKTIFRRFNYFYIVNGNKSLFFNVKAIKETFDSNKEI